MTKPIDSALVWFRRDLRADDHAALYAACRAARQVYAVFVYDTEILDPLPRADRRVAFIHDSLADLDAQLRLLGRSHGVEGVGLIVRHGLAGQALPALARTLGVQAVYAAHDDEPAGLARDAMVRGRLADLGNIVDITNCVLNELGQPLHAFDADKIDGRKIIISTLDEGQEFVTLDSVKRKLSSQDLMICDGNKQPLCMAGVYGGLGSGVTNETKNVFLDSLFQFQNYKKNKHETQSQN